MLLYLSLGLSIEGVAIYEHSSGGDNGDRNSSGDDNGGDGVYDNNDSSRDGDSPLLMQIVLSILYPAAGSYTCCQIRQRRLDNLPGEEQRLRHCVASSMNAPNS